LRISPSKDVGSIDGKDVPFEDFRDKVAMLKRSRNYNQLKLPALEQEQSLPAEFEKLGLRAGEIIY
jgi:peptidyl-prolyl cis-trans isomerase D